MTLDSIPVASGFRRGQVRQAYNEKAFRHFLAIEHARARRSRRSLYLVLVAIRQGAGRRATISDSTAMAIFAGLGTSVREVDFIGWYREHQVAAALLAQGARLCEAGVAPLIADRAVAELNKRLSTVESKNLRVRVVRLGGTPAGSLS